MSYKAAVLAKAGQAPKPMQFMPVGLSVLSDSASSSKQQEKRVAFVTSTTDDKGKSSRNRSERKTKHASKDSEVPLVSETFAPMSDKSSDEVVDLVGAAKKTLYSSGIDTLTETESIESPVDSGDLSASSKAPKIVEADKDATKRSFQALNELAEAMCSAKELVVVIAHSKPFKDSADAAKVMLDFVDDIKANLNVAVTVVSDSSVDEGDDLFARMI